MFEEYGHAQTMISSNFAAILNFLIIQIQTGAVKRPFFNFFGSLIYIRLVICVYFDTMSMIFLFFLDSCALYVQILKL